MGEQIQHDPDLIVFNAKVYTVERDAPQAEAFVTPLLDETMKAVPVLLVAVMQNRTAVEPVANAGG